MPRIVDAHRLEELVTSFKWDGHNTTQFKEINRGDVFESFNIILEAEFDGADPVPAGTDFGLASVIDSIYIRRNGNTPHFETFGEELHARHSHETGVAPFASPLIGSASTAQSVRCNLNWRFGPRNLIRSMYNEKFPYVGRDDFALDLRDIPGFGHLNRSAEIAIRWAQKSKVIPTTANSEITSLTVYVYGVKKIFAAGTQGTPQHWEMQTTREEKSFTGQPENFSHDLPRDAGGLLMDVLVHQMEGLNAVDFDAMAKYTLRHFKYEWKDALPLIIARQKSWELRRAVFPDNHMMIDIMEDGVLRQAINNLQLADQPLTLDLPTSIGSAEAATKTMKIYSRFAIPPQGI